MSNIISGQIVSQNGASGAAVTVTLASIVSTAQGTILAVRSYPGSSGVDATPPTPSGWTYAGGVVSTASTYKVREDIFYQRGTGTAPSVTFSATTSVARSVVIFAIDGVSRNTFVETVVTQPSNGNATTLTVNLAASAYTNTLAIAALGLGGTFGGSGATWNQGAAVVAGGAAGSHAIQAFSVAAPTATSMVASWTTTGNAALLGLFVGGDSATNPTPVVAQNDNTTVVDMTGSTAGAGGALSYAISPTANTAQPTTGIFVVTRVGTDQSFTITTSESGGGSATSNIVVLALDNIIRRRSFDGTTWL